jgi:hypothetical protein
MRVKLVLRNPWRSGTLATMRQTRSSVWSTPNARSCQGQDDTLRDALVIEMGNFLAEDEIFQKCGTARIGLERILIIGQRETLVRGQRRMLATGDLVQLSTSGWDCPLLWHQILSVFAFT